MLKLRPQITVRLMMAMTLVVAVASWLAVTAIRVHRDIDNRYLAHLRPLEPGSTTMIYTNFRPVGFWPRYWRRLLGQPWPGSYVCGCEADSVPGTTLIYMDPPLR